MLAQGNEKDLNLFYADKNTLYNFGKLKKLSTRHF